VQVKSCFSFQNIIYFNYWINSRKTKNKQDKMEGDRAEGEYAVGFGEK
jgi:hypothetical protein